MHFVYIDDSKDGTNICFSAIIVPANLWQANLDHLIGMRRQIKVSDGIYTTKELHATDWLGGRGRVAPFGIPKGARARIFEYVLSSIALMPGVQIINAHAHKRDEMELFERLINRLETNMKVCGSNAIMISDEGKNYDHLLRKMRHVNHIPSAQGTWASGATAKNIPVSRILEDIIYRDSSRSYFVQAADFCAFALLRHENPTAKIVARNLQDSFLIMENAFVKQAFAKDPKRLGIIRV